MAYDIGPQIGIEGQAEFKKALADVNTTLKTLGTEMKAVTSAFDSNDKSQEALTAQNQVLNKQIDEQKNKLELLKSALASASAEYGENDAHTQRLQQSVNLATAELNKMERQVATNNATMADAGGKSEEAGKKAKESGDDAEKGGKGWGSLKDGLSKVGEVAGQAVLALGAAAGAAATAIAGMAVKGAYAADDINTLSKQTGLSVEEIQKFQYASEQIDVPMETLTGSMAKLTKNMATAQKGTGAASDAFKALGVEITNQDGSLRSNQDVFNDAIKALGGMENSTQRDAYAMQIFGKSAQDLNPLILGGADALKELGDQAEAAGLILGQDSLDNLNQLSDAMDTFKATLNGSGSLFATAFAGPLAEGLNTITGYMTDLTSAFNDGGFSALSEKMGEIVSDIVLKLNETLPKILDFGLSIITKIVEGVTQNIPQLMSGATTIIVTLVDALIKLLPTLIQAALQIVVSLATGISESLPELIPSIVEAMLTIVDTLIENIDMLVDASIAIIMALADGLITALPVLVEKAPEIVSKLVTAVVENAPKLLSAALELVMKLVEGITTNLSNLGTVAGEIVMTVVNGILQLIPKFVDVGKNIVKGVWEGIKSMAKWLGDQVSGFFSSIVDGVKKSLGIHSPSTVFAGIGENMAAGIGVGFADQMKAVAKQLNNSIPTSFDSPTIAATNAASGAVNGMAALLGAQGVGASTFNIVLPDGTALASFLFDPLRGIIQQKGVALA